MVKVRVTLTYELPGLSVEELEGFQVGSLIGGLATVLPHYNLEPDDSDYEIEEDDD